MNKHLMRLDMSPLGLININRMRNIKSNTGKKPSSDILACCCYCREKKKNYTNLGTTAQKRIFHAEFAKF